MSSKGARAKICHFCNEDCSEKPRIKDERGRYACRECFEQARAKADEADALEETRFDADAVDDNEAEISVRSPRRGPSSSSPAASPSAGPSAGPSASPSASPSDSSIDSLAGTRAGSMFGTAGATADASSFGTRYDSPPEPFGEAEFHHVEAPASDAAAIAFDAGPGEEVEAVHVAKTYDVLGRAYTEADIWRLSSNFGLGLIAALGLAGIAVIGCFFAAMAIAVPVGVFSLGWAVWDSIRGKSYGWTVACFVPLLGLIYALWLTPDARLRRVTATGVLGAMVAGAGLGVRELLIQHAGFTPIV